MKQLTLRLTDELHAQLKAMAEADRRSIHAEVLWLIESALEAKRAP